jgi:hypothetical protein
MHDSITWLLRAQDEWLRALQRLDLRQLCARALAAVMIDGAMSQTERTSAAEPDPVWAAEQAVLLLALEVAQRPGGGLLLAGQGFWQHIQARGAASAGLDLRARSGFQLTSVSPAGEQYGRAATTRCEATLKYVVISKLPRRTNVNSIEHLA